MLIIQQLPKVTDVRPVMGCDPEFFFKLNGEVVGAEKLLPKEGLKRDALYIKGTSSVIIDGVQAELNPAPSFCRARVANEIKACFQVLNASMKEKGQNFSCDFNRAVEISEEKLAELDENSRKFGCAPSKSIYRHRAGVKLSNVNPEEYRIRAAGGHIHIGAQYDSGAQPSWRLKALLHENYRPMVRMLDILCGNTCVLVDRDPANIERRKMYGRAGEFRLPPHGLEYRTLSNFWLTSYPLMSLAFGMARLAVQLMADNRADAYYKAFTSRVKIKNIHTAINTNDFDLAMHNFKSIEDLLVQVSGENDNFVITKNTIGAFHYFVQTIKQYGITHWFKKDPLKYWLTLEEAHKGGIYNFLIDEVTPEMLKQTAINAA